MITRTITTWLTRFLVVVCIAIFIAHFWVVFQNAVNVPFWDEWGILSPDGLPAGFTFRWLVEPMNEHRMVPTKLLIWGLFYLDGHNHVISILITYAMWGVVLATIVVFARRVAPIVPLWATIAFIILLLTPISWENNFMGLESHIRFAILFSLVAVYFLFSEPQTGSRLAVGALTAVVATYSHFGGLVAVCILIAVFAWLKICRALSSSGSQRRVEYVQMITVVTAVLTFVALYFIDYHRVSYHPPLALPDEAAFWKFFTNLVSWGFGFETHSVVLGALCLLVVLVPIGLEIWRKRSQLPAASWAVYAFALAMLAVLASIAGGRANLSPSAKISHFADFGMMLVPFSALAWAIFLKDRPNLRKYVLVGLWIFCCLGFSYKWLWFSVYRVQGDSRKEGVECIKSYYKHGGPGMCPTLHAIPVGPMLDEGEKLNMSFYREIQGEL